MKIAGALKPNKLQRSRSKWSELIENGRSRVKRFSKRFRRNAVKRRPKPTRAVKRRPRTLIVGCATGAAGAYFLDPDNGKRRRHIARDRAFAVMRRGQSKARRRAEYMKGQAVGAAFEAGKALDEERPAPNDQALADRVQSEVFRPEEAPKDKVNVNVEDGVVYLRGQVDRAEEIEWLIDATRSVDGVREIENLLHTPGSPPRTKGEGSRIPAGSPA